MTRLILLLLATGAAGPLVAQTPAFADPQRVPRLRAAFPEIEKLMTRWAEERQVPGMSWGIVIDGETMLIKTTGFAEWPSKKPVVPETAFRIASMTKSFTALAILKLRDEGKLSLDDEVSRWIPEVGAFKYPTTDTAPLRVRQLLTHSAGFPEDNPWGDQQLDLPFGELNKWLRLGIPWSTPPDTQYEYSNYGFALLGRIVEKVSGGAYRDYLEREILLPLGMTHSTLEPALAKNAAVGYRREAGEYRIEPSLAHGAFGSMGGLVTTAPDLARYVAFQLSAYPPRDGDDPGPVRRSSVREMQRLWRVGGGIVASAATPDQPWPVRAGGYGYGLRISFDCRFNHVVSHGGGLPGFGSFMTWLPEFGVGLFAMTNLTYSAPAAPLDETWNVLRRTGALAPRTLAPPTVLTNTQQALFKLWNQWNQADAGRMAANNLFLDKSAAIRQGEIEAAKRKVGTCQLAGPVRAQNWLRGEFDLACDQGAMVRMTFTLAPTAPTPTVQHWSFITTPALTSGAQKAAERALRDKSLIRSHGSCRLGAVLPGDGTASSVVQLDCERGAPTLELTFNSKGSVTKTTISAPAANACLPQ